MTLNPPASTSYADLIRAALAEDIGTGDVTTAAIVAEGRRARGTLLAKSALVVAGLDVAMEAFRQLDRDVNVEVRWGDGAHVQPQDVIAIVSGDARALLTGERTALNILQRLSGVATLTSRFVTAADDRISVLDTRKTTPGWRALEKYAVRAGGGVNHRMDLADAVLIKDNHLAACDGDVAVAVKRALDMAPEGTQIEVECESPDQVKAAIHAGATIVLLDNMPLDMMRESVKVTAKRAELEASGGVTLDNVRAIAETGVDMISVGALTHSAAALNLALDFE